MPRALPVPPSEWTDPRHRLGLGGERVALAFLTGNGWMIEAHRFRVGRNDIDLVVRKRNLVAFVEVKTRRSTQYGSGGTAVGWRKRRAIGRVAEVWRARYGRSADTYRFDLCEVTPRSRGGALVVHLEDAWRMEWR